jgi:myeloid leukemia cell differentiation protein MCL-1
MSDSIHFNTPEGKIAKEVASQFISSKVGRNNQTKNNDVREEVVILLRLAREIEKDYGFTFNNMCNRLDVNSENAYFHFSTIAEEILVHGEENWGRIIILYAFAAKLAEKCKQSNNEQMIENIINWLSCLIARKSSWIRESGKGWEGFIKQFEEPRPNPNPKASWLQGLLAATVSCGTLAAIMLIKNSR